MSVTDLEVENSEAGQPEACRTVRPKDGTGASASELRLGSHERGRKLGPANRDGLACGSEPDTGTSSDTAEPPSRHRFSQIGLLANSSTG